MWSTHEIGGRIVKDTFKRYIIPLFGYYTSLKSEGNNAYFITLSYILYPLMLAMPY